VIYGMLGYKVEKLGDIEFVLKKCRRCCRRRSKKSIRYLIWEMRWMLVWQPFR